MSDHMTARDLIGQLNHLSEEDKDLPVVTSGGYIVVAEVRDYRHYKDIILWEGYPGDDLGLLMYQWSKDGEGNHGRSDYKLR